MKIKKISNSILFFIVLFSIFLLPSTFVMADEDDPDIDTDTEGIGESQKRDSERVVTVENDKDSASIKSVLNYGEEKDDFSIDITTLNNLKIKGLYKSHTAENRINLEFQIELYSLIEFNSFFRL